MKLDKIRDLLLELDDINDQIEDIHSYASLVIEKDLNIDIDFLFYKEKPQAKEQVFGSISAMFTATITSPVEQEIQDSEWSMSITSNQEVMLRVFGFLIDDLKKRKSSVVRRLKRLGVYEGTTDTSKKD
jgi:hypothetical protein